MILTVTGAAKAVASSWKQDAMVPQSVPTLVQRSLVIAYFLIAAFRVFRRLLLPRDVAATYANHKAITNDSTTIVIKVEEGSLDPQDKHRKCASQSAGKSVKTEGVADEDALKSDASATSVSNHYGVAEWCKDRAFVSANHLAHSPSEMGNHQTTQGEKEIEGERKESSHKSPRAAKTTPTPGLPQETLDTFLDSIVMLGAIMVFFYACDYSKILPQGERHYSRDTFLFLVFLLFLVASVFTMASNPDKILNREQTEEWKGWMQVMFVWYHYFMAKEWYNWIRVYIACYVWMTGFGNFSFFWMRGDYSLWRVLKMLFRLNFLVTVVAMTTNNEYLLYYICAMHTYWFVTVYLFMRVLRSWNTQPFKMAAKFAAYAVCNALIFDVPGMSQCVFWPLRWVLGFHDNHGNVMHEWSFRAGLDHWVCFLGMLCAYFYPNFEAFLTGLDTVAPHATKERYRKIAIRVALATGAVTSLLVWYFSFMRKDKYSYNATHPYTSTIPILAFILLRNIHPVLRTRHLAMFTWLGKITLETYISQLHIYLVSNATKCLLYIPGFPLLNFALATAVYLTLSRLLFHITNASSNFLVCKDARGVAKRALGLAVLFGASTMLAYGYGLPRM